MNGLQIRSVEIQGFRVFGQVPQSLAFASPIAAVWAPNSQGKTSLAEAFEFLLTGHIVRRQLMASSQDEFADALRNAHLPENMPVYVQAEIAGPDGAVHLVKRTLVADYGMRSDCETLLEIDGNAATNTDLSALGIVLSQPPLEAPVLAQHTLGYLFSARPQERAVYFKTLLGVTDLEDFRTAVVGLETEISAPDDERLTKFTTAVTIPESTDFLLPLQTEVPTAAGIETALSATAAALIVAEGEAVPDGFDDRIIKTNAILNNRRAKAFPVHGFNKQALEGWTGPTDAHYASIETYLEERDKVEEEVRRMAKLFNEALSLPVVAEAVEAVDCPLCTTEDALTPERIDFIRQQVAEMEEYQEAETEVRRTLGQMENSVHSLVAGVEAACPDFLLWPSHQRREEGFRLAGIQALLTEEEAEVVALWTSGSRKLARCLSHVRQQCAAFTAEISSFLEDLGQLTDKDTLHGLSATLSAAREAFTADYAQYLVIEEALTERLNAVIDAASQTTGWQELIDLAGDIDGLRTILVDNSARATVRAELTEALRQIDQAKETVLDDKFGELSDSTQRWWSLLRPDERAFFSSVKPRPGTRRTIDFKAGLSPHADRSNPKLRDVIAVFSQSQLHCLGLALFLARCQHEGSGFVVLDDPILSSDEDYRAHFVAAVVEQLIDLPIQLIIITQDQGTWKNLGHRYQHRDIDMFQMSLLDPVDGPVISHTSDDLLAKLTRVRSYLGADHPEMRKQAGERLRDAAERFCKEIQVRKRRQDGDNNAVLTDYDGQSLGQLIPGVEPLLTGDASHPGKLRAIPNALNPASHDDAIPDRGTLIVALGDLDRLRKDYL